MATRLQGVCPECDAVDDIEKFMHDSWTAIGGDISGDIRVLFKCPKCKAYLDTATAPCKGD